MQRWQITQDNQLELVTAERPEPGPQQVRVAVKAVGLNAADVVQIKGVYPPPAGYDPALPGLEYAGIIDAVGTGVVDKKIGDRVMGLIPTGSYSQSLCTHERETIVLPERLDYATGASLPEAFLTAYRALFIEGGLQPGQWCLVRPASAGVGQAAAQLAATLGARVIGSTRHPDSLAALELPLKGIAAEGEQLAKQLQAITENAGVDCVMDMVGGGWQALAQGLKPEARIVLVGVMGQQKEMLNLFSLLKQRLSIHAMTMRSQPIEKRIAMARLFTQNLAPLFASGQLKPLPKKTFAFSQAPAALEHLVSADFNGKRVLVMSC